MDKESSKNMLKAIALTREIPFSEMLNELPQKPPVNWKPESTLSRLVREIENERDKLKMQLDEIEATLQVNYGENGRAIKGLFNAHGKTTMQKLMIVLEYYHANQSIKL